MSRFLDLHRAAERDLAASAEYIRHHSPRSAVRFLRAARTTLNRLLGMPEMGSLYETDTPELAGLRFFPISRFENYLIFYRTTETAVEVIRVLHGSRDIESICRVIRSESLLRLKTCIRPRILDEIEDLAGYFAK